MSKFIIEFVPQCDDATNPLLKPSINAAEFETLPMAVRQVKKTLDAGAADEAIIYMPVRVLRASREVIVTDHLGKKVADDAAPSPLAAPPADLTVDVEAFMRDGRKAEGTVV